jgi:murein DD-endopeptidase MepM/ murein hydrolase activator NlpD
MTRQLVIFLVFATLTAPTFLLAQTAAEIQQKIDEQNAQLKQIDAEIAKYQADLDAATGKKKTLQSTIDSLNSSIAKLNASIKKTKNQISTTQLTIQQLSSNIAGKEVSIDRGVDGVEESLRKLNQAESAPLALQILSADDISSLWKESNDLRTLQQAIGDQIQILSQEKQSLEDTKKKTEAEKAKLIRQQNELVSQQGSLSAVKAAQTDLLKKTKAQESTFQEILTQKQAAKASFEAALLDLNAQFQQALDPSKIPTAGKGILSWPVDNVRITQYFGNTPFAQSGAYSGKGHNGIDLAAPIGTPLKAALSGVVLATGDTDVGRCYSFGKWVMIKHPNGLSTMYSHLSQIKAVPGQSVSTGQLIGYSGETGYATGPHLHFGVYVTSNTQIIKLGSATKSKSACSDVVMPVTQSLSGYLNPLNYL